jgi:acylphosphatase
MRVERSKQPGLPAFPKLTLNRTGQSLFRVPAQHCAANLLAAALHLSATISKFVTDAKQARRYFVSGFVQGVGFRNFTQNEANRLGLSGYVCNLRDGRVEAYAIGTPAQLTKFRAALDRGPRFSSVSQVREEPATVDWQYANDFVITHES